MKKIFKFILSFFQFVFIIFLFLLLMIKSYWFISEKINDNKFPSISGYSYLEVNTRYLFDEFKINEYLLIKQTDNVKKGDYIIVLNESNIELYKVDSFTTSTIICKDRNDELYSVVEKDIKGKVIYHNEKVSNIINILTSPIVVLLMLVYCLFIGQVTYERFDYRMKSN